MTWITRLLEKPSCFKRKTSPKAFLCWFWIADYLFENNWQAKDKCIVCRLCSNIFFQIKISAIKFEFNVVRIEASIFSFCCHPQFSDRSDLWSYVRWLFNIFNSILKKMKGFIKLLFGQMSCTLTKWRSWQPLTASIFGWHTATNAAKNCRKFRDLLLFWRLASFRNFLHFPKIDLALCGIFKILQLADQSLSNHSLAWCVSIILTDHPFGRVFSLSISDKQCLFYRNWQLANLTKLFHLST